MRDYLARSFVLLGLIACGRERTADKPIAVPGASEVECAPEPSEELCAVLCRVPGGVEECPVGTPCPDRAAEQEETETLVQKSLCSRADTGKSCLTSR